MNFNPKNLNEAHNIMFERYLKLLDNSIQITINFETSQVDYLKNMCNTMLISNDIPIDKKARWLGFIQGCLFANGFIEIKEEREFSRPLFIKFYENPISIDLKENI